MSIRTLLSTCLIVATIAFCGSAADAFQNVTVGQAVSPKQQVSMDQVDHSTWNQLLQKYVNENGEVNYKGWHDSLNDVQSLDSYLAVLSTASRTARATKDSTIAYWVNAYNAVTIKGILREYPTTSIRNHTAKLFGYNIWKNLMLNVGDTQISLNDIEHEVLRKMGEPRIHFAIVCASHSCPRLLNQAYTSADLENQLVANTKSFFANQENFTYDAPNRRFQVSSILKWFATDFGRNQSTQLKTIAPYLPTKAAQDAANGNSVRVFYKTYDWSLNEQKPQRAAATGNRRR